ncbi:MAG: beta-ketoacyl synthase [Pontibacterium sp.]
MSQLPLIVGFGGINPAGRGSSHHAYRRLIIDQLDAKSRQETLTDIAVLTGLIKFEEGAYTNQTGQVCSLDKLLDEIAPQLLDNTLIRKIEPSCFDVDKVPSNTSGTMRATDDAPVKFQLRSRHMPKNVPEHWQVTELRPGQFEIQVSNGVDVIFPDSQEWQVKAAGQLPTGFAPGSLYQSRNHPRNLQMTIFGASDALRSSGLEFDFIASRVRPDQIAVYASNSIGQLDDYGFGGLTKFPALGKRTTSKQMPLGYAQMPADFINAYVLGSAGTTGGALGACATFLYNLRSGVEDIRSGRRKVVLVGGSDAPITPEVIEGFRVMGVLADDKSLKALDGVSELTAEHYRRTCRPFAENCGFTIGESSQFIMLMADDLALELGADIYGMVPDVFVNADGYKKSISAPGIGNYITLGKSASLVREMLGEASLKQRSAIQAHGTSTPQNRVTESHVLNETAKAFGIEHWPVSAVKCFLGHSQGTAGGDQLTTSLGIWKYGYLPGITTVNSFADDIHRSNLSLSNQHTEVGSAGLDSIILNSKGFGGNNASAPLMAPHIAEQLLKAKHGEKAFADYQAKRESVREQAAQYDAQMLKGELKPIYRYDHNVLAGEDLSITDKEIRMPGYEQAVDLSVDNPFKDLTE